MLLFFFCRCFFLHVFALTRDKFANSFNKTDVVRHEFAREWMTDFEAFQTAARDAPEQSDEGGSYMSSLTQSMGLVLEEFYRSLEWYVLALLLLVDALSTHARACNSVGVSAHTGDGFDTLFAAVERAKHTFATEYAVELEARLKAQTVEQEEARQRDLERLERDLVADRAQTSVLE